MLIYIVPGSIIWFALSVLAGIVASKKGRSGTGYFFLSLFLSPLIGLLAAALLPALEKGAENKAGVTAFLIPIAMFALLGLLLAYGLKLDPRKIPSPLVDKPLPAFSLPTLENPN